MRQNKVKATLEKEAAARRRRKDGDGDEWRGVDERKGRGSKKHQPE